MAIRSVISTSFSLAKETIETTGKISSKEYSLEVVTAWPNMGTVLRI